MLPLSARDLAPGDARSAELDLAAFSFQRIRSVADPLFEIAYELLWAEFGAKNEMERRATLEQRFALAPEMLYELVLVRREGEPVAVRDHTAIRARSGVIVHLSHNLVLPAWRRSGLAGWMRAVPIAAARELDPDALVTLAAEMEYADARDEQRLARLRAYERAGFRKVDPSVLKYHQPDFRAPEVIDATGGPQPVPFQLLLRRVGREGETEISGAGVREIVAALHGLYARQFRAEDMQHPLLSHDNLPPASATLSLLLPTAH